MPATPGGSDAGATDTPAGRRAATRAVFDQQSKEQRRADDIRLAALPESEPPVYPRALDEDTARNAGRGFGPTAVD